MVWWFGGRVAKTSKKTQHQHSQTHIIHPQPLPRTHDTQHTTTQHSYLVGVAAAAARRERVHLVEEEHARVRGARAREERAHGALALADVLVEQLGALEFFLEF